MLRFDDHRPVQPLRLDEARRMIRDPHYAAQFDPMTRMIAWRMCLAARKGLTCPVLVLVAGFAIPTQPPKDAA